jgi:hypothetical protein
MPYLYHAIFQLSVADTLVATARFLKVFVVALLLKNYIAYAGVFTSPGDKK